MLFWANGTDCNIAGHLFCLLEGGLYTIVGLFSGKATYMDMV